MEPRDFDPASETLADYCRDMACAILAHRAEIPMEHARPFAAAIVRATAEAQGARLTSLSRLLPATEGGHVVFRGTTTETRETTMHTTPTTYRYHRTDGWRGYRIPRLAVVGASDTGMEPDSPAPSDEVTYELALFRHFLIQAGIRMRETATPSSNVFMVKRWLTVSAKDFPRAAELAMAWLDENRAGTHYIHDADLDELREPEEETA